MNRRSLRFKLVTAGILMVLIPLLVVGLFSSYKSSTAMQAMGNGQAVAVAKSLSALVETAMTDEVKLLTILAADLALMEPASVNNAAVSAELAAFYKQIGNGYEGLYVTDASGVIQAEGTGPSSGLNLGDRDYFQAAKTGKVAISNPVKSKKTGNPIVVVAAPVYHNGNFSGVVGAPMKTDTLAERLASIKIGQTGYAFMVDKTGRVVTHPKKELVIEAVMSNFKGMEEINKKVLAQQTGAERYVFNGVNKVAGFAPVPVTGWSVVTTQDESEFLAASASIRNMILLSACVFLGLAIVGLFFFSRSITLPIGKATAQLTEASSQVASASNQVASASQSLAEGASEQASSLEETSSSLEEMSAMTRQNADNASQADGLMKTATAVVKNANEAMVELTASMNDISTASGETSKIIKTIDEIAFQTNLLALNAAVEAARAGEAGAGFAVVADEVRNLALRAAEAAKNTSTLIEDTVKKIKNGSALVVKTSDSFSEVTLSTNKVGELVGEIAAASKEQAQGIDQINQAVTQMNTVVQTTAANAEESSAASEEMNAQAEQMRQVVEELMRIVGGRSEEFVRTSPGNAPSTGREIAPKA